uniref:TIL domain-containing protein n=1 Tax=Setaria digitata TaxID=48799 RepID=A0A915Q157_9BILA
MNGRPNCGPNEEWTPFCASGCELTCDDIEPVICYKRCYRPRCQCIKHKNIRRNKDGKCVPINECP